MTVILSDQDLGGRRIILTAIGAVEAFLLARAQGKAIAPPRHHVSFARHGELVFTIGGVSGDQPLAGFRVYDTFKGPEHTQIVAVWSSSRAELKGLILGTFLGAIRTGAIWVAIQHLSNPAAHDLKPGAHVNTIGPKTIAGHELGRDIAAIAEIIVTDSVEQTRAYSSPFFLKGSGHEARMVELSDLVAKTVRGRISEQEISLFCSVGLAGTEVAVAAALLDQHQAGSFCHRSL